jgi:hypothetical protein
MRYGSVGKPQFIVLVGSQGEAHELRHRLFTGSKLSASMR